MPALRPVELPAAPSGRYNKNEEEQPTTTTTTTTTSSSTGTRAFVKLLAVKAQSVESQVPEPKEPETEVEASISKVATQAPEPKELKTEVSASISNSPLLIAQDAEAIANDIQSFIKYLLSFKTKNLGADTTQLSNDASKLGNDAISKILILVSNAQKVIGAKEALVSHMLSTYGESLLVDGNNIATAFKNEGSQIAIDGETLVYLLGQVAPQVAAQAAQGVASALSYNIPGVFLDAGQILSEVIQSAPKLFASIEKITTDITDLAEQLKMPTSAVISNLLSLFNNSILPEIKEVISLLASQSLRNIPSEILNGAESAIAKIQSVAAELYLNMSVAEKTIIKDTETAVSYLTKMLGSSPTLTSDANQLISDGEALSSDIKTLNPSSAFSEAKKIFTDLIEGATDLGEIVKQDITIVEEKVVQNVTSTATKITTDVKQTAENVVQDAKQVVQEVEASVTVLEDGGFTLTKLITAAGDATSDVVDGASKSASDIKTGAGNVVSDFVEEVETVEMALAFK